MKFITDVPIGRKTVEFLRSHGHDVIRSTDRLAPNAADSEILEVAVREDRIVLCFDLDFVSLMALSERDRPSIILFRTRRRGSEEINRRLSEVLVDAEEELSRGAIVVVEDSRIRIRDLPL